MQLAGTPEFQVGRQMRIDEVGIAVFGVHRGNGLANAGVAVEDLMPGAGAAGAVMVAGEIQHGGGELKRVVRLRQEGQSAICHLGGQAVAAHLHRGLHFAAQILAEFRQNAEAGGVALDILALLVVL